MPGVVMEEPLNKNLNKKFTFENFVIGEENKFAYQVAVTITEPSNEINPIYIEGACTGLGVTHLLQAISWKLKKEHPQKKFIYTNSYDFLYEYINSLKNKTVSAFKEKYIQIDYLLFDVVQFILNKNALQIELCYLFDRWIENGTQLIFGGECLQKMSELNPELKSRFESSVIAEIKPPGYKLRMDIIRKKSENCLVEFDDNALEFLAKNITGSIRRLEGAFVHLKTYASLNDQSVSMKTITEIGDIYFDNEQRYIR